MTSRSTPELLVIWAASLVVYVLFLAACGDDTATPRPTVSPLVIGQDGVIPPIGTQEVKPATNAYPFSRWMTLPAGTEQLSVFEAPGGSPWIATFALPSTSLAAVETLRREAESKDLDTISISTGAGGFSLHGDIEGLLQVQSFDANSQTILIALTKRPR
jgi:hypothetical protein